MIVYKYIGRGAYMPGLNVPHRDLTDEDMVEFAALEKLLLLSGLWEPVAAGEPKPEETTSEQEPEQVEETAETEPEAVEKKTTRTKTASEGKPTPSRRRSRKTKKED